MLQVRRRHDSAFASDRLTSHELLLSVILAFKDMHSFSYILAPKCKPVTSSGAQSEKSWIILAERGFSYSLRPQIPAQDRTATSHSVKPLPGAHESCPQLSPCPPLGTVWPGWRAVGLIYLFLTLMMSLWRSQL